MASPVSIPSVSPRSNRASWLAAITGVVLLANGVHCVACDAIGCVGGYSGTARAADDSTLAPGTYTLVVELEGTRHELQCTIAEGGLADSRCDETVPSTDEFELSVELQSRQAGTTWDRHAPIEALVIRAWADDDDGTNGSTRGPTEVGVELRQGDRVMLSSHDEIEYERDEDFYGDERCGYCDLEQARDMTWTP